MDLDYHVRGAKQYARNSCGSNTCSIYNRFLDDSKVATSSLVGSVSVSSLSYTRPRPETFATLGDPTFRLQCSIVYFCATTLHLQDFLDYFEWATCTNRQHSVHLRSAMQSLHWQCRSINQSIDKAINQKISKVACRKLRSHCKDYITSK